ncbi:hypothetical protein L873DRAFT_19484 [Choiromyces venosus 120613-1]|uniref:Uncharacterized protein n=1 Tax=Choiromyces venosus 120613-1 TaxID=1336337 RepID=A0A3N4K6P0_9PEZI|nr:hypothetical protein L873DRAFT_19484 [Choiromyces venosus 120613-1]
MSEARSTVLFDFALAQVVVASSADLVTSLECKGRGGCYLPDAGFRSTLGLLLTALIPVLSSTTQSIYMKPLKQFLKRCMDILLLIFFPEIGLYKGAEGRGPSIASLESSALGGAA